ncbi:GNAT family N-acetyltransferase [Flavobacterium aciduliphilum]|uniref:Putative acetyltransferase n=1 Tax=Flavobacterium aciduliphilum TaxID=1101402 RepID=A0A328Y7Y3_9FLAO|nr:GNAT family N-acetyltransferase [Flavobacterium aciduliphilum]RAR70019.1 putative acetyltransferase [Flavobacterium aciduliphilum]
MYSIRKATINDISKMQDVFVKSITTSCFSDYDIQQIKIWTSSVQDNTKWQQLIVKQYTLIAFKEDEVVGFGSLEHNGIIDMLYTAPHVQRNGIAKLLHRALESKALELHLLTLTAEVSLTAVPFFKKMRYNLLSEQKKEYKGVLFTNFTMQKKVTVI